MDAACPACIGEDAKTEECKECSGTGTITVGFAEGALYTKTCVDPQCGYQNGGRIVGPGLPPIEDTQGSPMDCIICGAEAEYVLVGWLGEEEIGE